MRREFHVIGPPGTGKSSYLAERAVDAVIARGPASVVIVSLTKAAAVEIASKVDKEVSKRGLVGLTIPRDHVGTLHSICLHGGGLSGKPVLDSPKGFKLWNEWVKQNARKYDPPLPMGWQLSGGTSADDPMSGIHDPTMGTLLLERLSLARHRMMPPDLWPDSVTDFGRCWNQAMEELGATDFTGMIEAGLDMDRPPFSPSVLLADEVQDFSRLEGEVVRRWAQNVETCILVGDEDQVLYSWRGADPEIFSGNPVPPENRRILGQSYRVPAAVHELAQRVIQGVRSRTDNPYLPRPEEPGSANIREDASWQHPEGWLDDVLRGSERGGAMVLAPCAYALQPLIRLMREEGIPFHNPYRRNRGDWNPLGNQDSENRTAANQVLAFLGGGPDYWHVEELKAWIPLLQGAKHRVPLLDDNAYLRYGVKAALQRRQEAFLKPQEYLDLFQEPEEGLAAFRRDLGWLVKGMAQKERDRTAFPLALLRKGGPELLRAEPKIIVGTIHSVKGGESRHVYLMTALPNRWSEDQGDEIHRLMYVGITRARESITILCGDRGGYDGF